MNKNGFPTTGIVLEKRNSIVAASKYRYYVLPRTDGKAKSVGDTMVDESQKAIWETFESNLLKYKERRDAKPEEIRDYCIDPYAITSSIHA